MSVRESDDCVRQAVEEEWATALGILFAESEQRGWQIETSLAELQERDQTEAGLIVMERDQQVVGACWCQRLGGGVGVLWLPRFLDGGDRWERRALMHAADEFIVEQSLRLVQSIVGDGDESDEELLVEFGFRYASDLVLMTCTEDRFPAGPPDSPLDFEEYRSSEEGRLAQLVERTYQGTLDFPVLEGVREMSEVLSGYRETGAHQERLWFFVKQGGHDLGCLLLSEHSSGGHPREGRYELVYFGVVPEWRGKGWGRDIVRFAQWVTHRDLCPQVVLAVDAANAPALAVYGAAGFDKVDRRRVFLRIPC